MTSANLSDAHEPVNFDYNRASMRFHEIYRSKRKWAGRMLIRVSLIATAAVAAVAIGSASAVDAEPLKPEMHSAIAHIDLPEGTVPCTSSGCKAPHPYEEVWRYNAPHDAVVDFFRLQFVTPPDNTLPACPPGGPNDASEWKWSDDARWLAVAVYRPGREGPDGDSAPFGKIYIACGPVDPPRRGGRCFHSYL